MYYISTVQNKINKVKCPLYIKDIRCQIRKNNIKGDMVV